MVKVHCIISCLCEVIKRRTKIDYRPYYFGIWDAEYSITDQGVVTYYIDNHEEIIKGYERLFRAKVTEWYDHSQDKASNLDTFLELIDKRTEDQFVLVQIDMSLVPERDNKFALKPFPHFLMISKTENEDEWFMFDPDFRWEGNVKKETVIKAFLENPFGGGFMVDASEIKEPTYEMIHDYFYAALKRDHNPFTLELKQLITDMAEGRNGYNLDMLLPAVTQVKVIAIRKYSYEYAFLYLQDYLQYHRDEFLRIAYKVEDIYQGFTTAQYLSVKMAMTKNMALLPPIIEALEEIDLIELEVKKELERQFVLWTQMEKSLVTVDEKGWR
jgi:petrobactin synthase